MGAKVSRKEAEKIKKDYIPLSPLERMGLFDSPGIALTEDEQKTLDYINSLSTEKVGCLFTALCMAEDGKLYSESDIVELTKRGIKPADRNSMTFAYALINDIFNGNGGCKGGEEITEELEAISEYAMVKAVSRIEPISRGEKGLESAIQENILTDGQLKECVRNNVEAVEAFLTRYFSAVWMAAEHFMPMSIETNDGRINAEKPKHSDYWLDDEKDKYEKMTTRSLKDNARLSARNLRIIHPKGTRFRFGKDHSVTLSIDDVDPRFLFFIADKDDNPHPGLRNAVFGAAIKDPAPIVFSENKYEKILEIDYKGEGLLGSWKARRKTQMAQDFLRFMASKFGHAGDVTDEFDANIGVFSKEKVFDSRKDMEHYLREFMFHLPYYFKPNDLRSIEYEISPDFRRIKFYVTEKKDVRIDMEEGVIEPVFIFPHFDELSYSLRTYKQFWRTLNAYAQIPQYVNGVLLEAFRDNYLADPSMDMDACYQMTKDGLKDLFKVLDNARSNGRLNGNAVIGIELPEDKSEEEKRMLTE